MVCPTQNAMRVLDAQLERLSNQGDVCTTSITFEKLYGENETSVYGCLNDKVVNYLYAANLIDKFCSLATKTRQVFCRKFTKYHLDRSYYQNQYDAIIDRVAKGIVSNACLELKKMDSIPEEKFVGGKLQHVERVGRDIYKAAKHYQEMITKQRMEWPVISRQKKAGHWHNRGITKNIERKK